MNWRRPDILSWKLYRIWEDEWPHYRPNVIRWWGTVIRPSAEYKRWWPLEVIHVTMNLLTEGLRSFAYTLAHLIVLWMIWGVVTWL